MGGETHEYAEVAHLAGDRANLSTIAIALASAAEQIEREVGNECQVSECSGNEDVRECDSAHYVGEREKEEREQRQERDSILSVLQEAWKCWKANVPWHSHGCVSCEVESRVRNAVASIGNEWEASTMATRENIRNGKEENNVKVRAKNLNRITRQWMRREQERQLSYLRDGPYIDVNESIALYTSFLHWLEMRGCEKIPFPPLDCADGVEILHKALDSMRSDLSSPRLDDLSQEERAELEIIESAYSDPVGALHMIKRCILTKRSFDQIRVSLRDQISHLKPVYDVQPIEKLADAYVDMYLWHAAAKTHVFPSWVKPIDSEPIPSLVHRCCIALQEIVEQRDEKSGDSIVFLQTELHNLYQNASIVLINRLLRLVLDHNIADYMTARMDASELSYKDMTVKNSIGLIRGIRFCSFITQFYALAFDILLLGPRKAFELSGSLAEPRDAFSSAKEDIGASCPARFYCRVVDKIYYALSFSKENAHSLVERYLTQFPEGSPYVKGGNVNPWSGREDLDGFNALLARAVFLELSGCLPSGLVSLDWRDSTVSVYDDDSNFLSFVMEGFDVRVLLCSSPSVERLSDGALWEISGNRGRDRTATVEVRVNEMFIQQLEGKIRLLLMDASMSAFATAREWNATVLDFMTYFREAVFQYPELMKKLSKLQQEVCYHILRLLSCGACCHLPPDAIFLSPEVGGLGLLNVDSSLSQKPLFWPCKTSADSTPLPSISSYVESWAEAFHEGHSFCDTITGNKHCGWRIRLLFTEFFCRHIPPVKQVQWDHVHYATDLHTVFHDRGCLSIAPVIGTPPWSPVTRDTMISDAQFLLWWSPSLISGSLGGRAHNAIEELIESMDSSVPGLEEHLRVLLGDSQVPDIHECVLKDILAALDDARLFDQNGNLFVALSGNRELLYLQGIDGLHCSEASLVTDAIDTFPYSSERLTIGLELTWGLTGKPLDELCAKRIEKSCRLSDDKGILLMVDISTASFTAFGSWITGLKEILIETLSDVFETNSSLFKLRSRILEMMTGGSKAAEPLNTGNKASLFSSQVTWLIDECSFSTGVADGDSPVKHPRDAENSLVIFTPKTGETIFLPLPLLPDACGEHLKKKQLCWRAAGLLVTFIDSLAENVRPKALVFMRDNLYSNVRTLLSSSCGISLRRSFLKLPLHCIGKLPRVIQQQQEIHYPATARMNLYGNWLACISSFTAFSRLMYILRALERDRQATLNILFGACEAAEVTWILRSSGQWIEAENALKSVILESYCEKHHLDVKKVSHSEAHEIIFAGELN